MSDDEVKDIIENAIFFQVQAVGDDGDIWVDGISDAAADVVRSLSEAGYVIVKRPTT